MKKESDAQKTQKIKLPDEDKLWETGKSNPDATIKYLQKAKHVLEV